MKRIDIIHGVNLNLLGIREPDIYGYTTLDEINEKCKNICEKENLNMFTYQSNIEGELVNYINSLIKITDGIIINPGAYTHYSLAIRDSLINISKPIIEVHLSNIFSRESFRKVSVISDIVKGIIVGFGEYSYYLAVNHIKKII